MIAVREAKGKVRGVFVSTAYGVSKSDFFSDEMIRWWDRLGYIGPFVAVMIEWRFSCEEM